MWYISVHFTSWLCICHLIAIFFKIYKNYINIYIVHTILHVVLYMHPIPCFFLLLIMSKLVIWINFNKYTYFNYPDWDSMTWHHTKRVIIMVSHEIQSHYLIFINVFWNYLWKMTFHCTKLEDFVWGGREEGQFFPRIIFWTFC